jgi:hypothetical protein
MMNPEILSSLRGRRPVRADRRLRTDEKHIRAQSAILDNTQPQADVAFIHNRVFGTHVLFMRTENTVGARSAQFRRSHATVSETSQMVSGVGKHGATHG